MGLMTEKSSFLLSSVKNHCLQKRSGPWEMENKRENIYYIYKTRDNGLDKSMYNYRLIYMRVITLIWIILRCGQDYGTADEVCWHFSCVYIMGNTLYD